MAKPGWTLLFDSDSEYLTCSRVAEIVRDSRADLVLKSLDDPEVQSLLNERAPGWTWQPMLLDEYGQGRLRVSTGLVMGVRLARLIGVRAGVRMSIAASKSAPTAPRDDGLDRRGLIARAAAVAGAAGLGQLGGAAAAGARPLVAREPNVPRSVSDRPRSSRSMTPAERSLTSRLGGWLPRDRGDLDRWLRSTIDEAETRSLPFHPVVLEFQEMIESDPVMYMYFTQMFKQQSRRAPPVESGDVKLKNYQQMLVVINHVLTTAPAYNNTDLVGFPINAILDFPMITQAGLAAFVAPKVNDMFRKVLAVWTQFLDSKGSLYVLSDSPTGWLNPAARKTLRLDEFETDPTAPYLGFRSWNDFFIRKFKPGRRPVAEPGNDKAIVSACESQPFAIQTGVKENDTFWIKSQPYSLRQMLNGKFVEQFVGGTVYQAFLSATKYHRWHSPVSGTIVKLEELPGTYYAEAASEGFDPAGPNNSQGYIAHVATRALIFIEADDPSIGLLCLMPVGMAEVSSCVLVGKTGRPLRRGQHVRKGDQVGYFQFGGSTHCLVFRPSVVLNFERQAIPMGENGEQSALVKVNSLLATAT
jgi:phosphatidylserine decarboxylase